jgi:hypothetical protein
MSAYIDSKAFAVSEARRVNKLVIHWKRAGDMPKALHCKGYRNLWMAEARRASF